MFHQPRQLCQIKKSFRIRWDGANRRQSAIYNDKRSQTNRDLPVLLARSLIIRAGPSLLGALNRIWFKPFGAPPPTTAESPENCEGVSRAGACTSAALGEKQFAIFDGGCWSRLLTGGGGVLVAIVDGGGLGAIVDRGPPWWPGGPKQPLSSLMPWAGPANNNNKKMPVVDHLACSKMADLWGHSRLRLNTSSVLYLCLQP